MGEATNITVGTAPVADVSAVDEVTDALGRKLRVFEPDILSESRLVRIMGQEAAMNFAYMMGYVMPAAKVSHIDGDPVPFPNSQREVDALIKRLGREGIAAVQAHLMPKAAASDEESDLKNS